MRGALKRKKEKEEQTQTQPTEQKVDDEVAQVLSNEEVRAILMEEGMQQKLQALL